MSEAEVEDGEETVDIENKSNHFFSKPKKN